MLDSLRNIAVRLAFLRPIFGLLGLAALAMALMEIFGERDGTYLIPALLLMMWSLVGFSSLGLFQRVPERTEAASVVARIKSTVLRGFFFLLAIAFVCLTAAGLYMTYRLTNLPAA